MALAAADIRHGMAVTAQDGSVWEILDRHPKANHWWLHSRDAAGAWHYSYTHQSQLSAAGLGSWQETLISEEQAA